MMKEDHHRSLSAPLSLSLPNQSPPESRHVKAERRRRLRQLLALAPVLVVAWTQAARLSRYRTDTRSVTKSRSRKLGLINFVDERSAKNLWGVYSIHEQMKKFGMLPTVQHIAVVSQDVPIKSRALLKEWLGPEQVREMDKNLIVEKVHDGLNGETFLINEAFNMTEFDKLIVLDNAVLIRQSLLHWFDHPSPAATQYSGVVEWNTGAMVIEPDTGLYNQLIKYIPLSRKWKPYEDVKDTWNSDDGWQGFLSAFLTSNITDHSMFTMTYSAVVLSNDMEDQRCNHYYWEFRDSSIETVHFTRYTPWEQTSERTKNPPLCSYLREWMTSVADAPKDKLPALPDFLSQCK